MKKRGKRKAVILAAGLLAAALCAVGLWRSQPKSWEAVAEDFQKEVRSWMDRVEIESYEVRNTQSTNKRLGTEGYASPGRPLGPDVVQIPATEESGRMVERVLRSARHGARVETRGEMFDGYAPKRTLAVLGTDGRERVFALQPGKLSCCEAVDNRGETVYVRVTFSVDQQASVWLCGAVAPD